MGNRRPRILDSVVSVVAFVACVAMLVIAIGSNDAFTMIVLLSIGLVIGIASVATVVNMVRRCMESDYEMELDSPTVIERHSDPTDLPPTYEECVATGSDTNYVMIGIPTISHSVALETGGRDTVAVDIDLYNNRNNDGCHHNEGFEYDEPPPPSYQEALVLKARAQSLSTSTS